MNRRDRKKFAVTLLVAEKLFHLMLREELKKYLFKELQKQAVSRCGPPRSVQFLLLLLPKRNREHLIGDLEEEFQTIVLPQYGRFLAKCWYFEQVAFAISCYIGPTVKKILGLSILYKLIGK